MRGARLGAIGTREKAVLFDVTARAVKVLSSLTDTTNFSPRSYRGCSEVVVYKNSIISGIAIGLRDRLGANRNLRLDSGLRAEALAERIVTSCYFSRYYFSRMIFRSAFRYTVFCGYYLWLTKHSGESLSGGEFADGDRPYSVGTADRRRRELRMRGPIFFVPCRRLTARTPLRR